MMSSNSYLNLEEIRVFEMQSSYIHFNMSILIIQVKDEAFIGNQKELPFQFSVDSDTIDKNQANNRILMNIPIYYEVGAKVQGYAKKLL